MCPSPTAIISALTMVHIHFGILEEEGQMPQDDLSQMWSIKAKMGNNKCPKATSTENKWDFNSRKPASGRREVDTLGH